LKPRLEEWLIGIANRESIMLSKYKIPDNGKILHGLGRYDKEPFFREFLDAIKNSGNEDVKSLAKLLLDSNR